MAMVLPAKDVTTDTEGVLVMPSTGFPKHSYGKWLSGAPAPVNPTTSTVQRSV